MMHFYRSLNLRSLSWLLHAVGGAVAVALLVLSGVAYQRLERRLVAAQAEQTQAMGILEQTRELHEQLRRARLELNTVEQEVQAWQVRLPVTPDETGFLQRLSGLADTADVQLRNFVVGAVASRGTHQELELRFRGEGGYAGVCRFLSGLQDLHRIYRVSHLSIDAPTVAGEPCVLDLQLRLAFDLKSAGEGETR